MGGEDSGEGRGWVDGVEEALLDRCGELEDEASRLRRERDEARLKLGSARARLVDQARLVSLGRLVAGVAHELNNPVNFVYGGSVALAERLEAWPVEARGPGFDEVLRLAAVIRTGGERVRDIIRELLSLSRPAATERAVFAADEAARSAAALLDPWARGRGVVIEVEAAPRLHVEGSRGEIGQVLMNLLNNAVHASQGGRVRLVAASRPEGVALSVSDDGPGVDEALRERIFEAFFTTKPEGEGTGLGLSISRSIAEAHGGRIEVTEAESGGAVFTLLLPHATKGGGKGHG